MFNLEDIKIGDTVHCVKLVDSQYDGSGTIDPVTNTFKPSKPGNYTNPIRFHGKVYAIIGNVLQLDCPGGSAAAVNFNNVVRIEKEEKNEPAPA